MRSHRLLGRHFIRSRVSRRRHKPAPRMSEDCKGRGVSRSRRKGFALGALLAVVGPGLLAGLSDDDPAGITTYSVLGADHGYQLLWVLLLSTVALVLFHGLAARMGVVTGQGLIGLVRQRYGVRSGGAALAALVVANVGTTCAEFAGIAAGSELFGVSRYVSVPAAAVTVSLLVLRGSFHRVEHFLLLLSAVFLAYVVVGYSRSSRLGGGAARPVRAEHARQRRIACDRHRHRRHHSRAVGALVHSVLRGRQKASHRRPPP